MIIQKKIQSVSISEAINEYKENKQVLLTNIKKIIRKIEIELKELPLDVYMKLDKVLYVGREAWKFENGIQKNNGWTWVDFIQLKRNIFTLFQPKIVFGISEATRELGNLEIKEYILSRTNHSQNISKLRIKDIKDILRIISGIEKQLIMKINKISECED